MKEYQRTRTEREHSAVVVGLLLTIGLHAGALALVSFTGIKYLWPPPEETAMLIEFTEEELPELKPVYGREPQGEDVDPEAPVNIVQRSESPFESTAQNITPETKPDDFGDVPVQEPEHPEEPKLDPRLSSQRIIPAILFSTIACFIDYPSPFFALTVRNYAPLKPKNPLIFAIAVLLRRYT